MKCDEIVFLGQNDAVLVAVTLPDGQKVCLMSLSHQPLLLYCTPTTHDLCLQDNRNNACTGVSTAYRAGEESTGPGNDDETMPSSGAVMGAVGVVSVGLVATTIVTILRSL